MILTTETFCNTLYSVRIQEYLSKLQLYGTFGPQMTFAPFLYIVLPQPVFVYLRTQVFPFVFHYLIFTHLFWGHFTLLFVVLCLHSVSFLAHLSLDCLAISFTTSASFVILLMSSFLSLYLNEMPSMASSIALYIARSLFILRFLLAIQFPFRRYLLKRCRYFEVYGCFIVLECIFQFAKSCPSESNPSRNVCTLVSFT